MTPETQHIIAMSVGSLAMGYVIGWRLGPWIWLKIWGSE